MAVAVALPLVLSANPDPRLRAGVMLHDRGDFRAAVEVYRTILRDRPNDPATVYELGYSLLAKGDYAAALELIEGARGSGVAQSPRLFALEANALDAQGQHPAAEATLRAGLALEPANPELHYSLGVNLSTQQRWPLAAASFLEAVRLGPTQPSPWWGLGRALQEQGQPERAALAFARAATLQGEPTRAQAASERAAALLRAADAAALARGLSAVEGDGDELVVARPFFTEARAKGHLEALAYELRRLAKDPAAEVWCAQNAPRVAGLREWAAGYNLRSVRQARARPP